MDRLLTPEQVAEHYGHPTTQTLAYWRRMGTGPKYLMAGRHVRYRESAVAAYDAELEQEQTAKTRARAEAVKAS